MTRSDNTSNITGKTLLSRRFERELCAHVQTQVTKVPHGTAPTTLTFGVFEASIETQDNTTKSSKVDLVKVDWVTVSDKQLEYAWGELQGYAPSSTTTATMVNASSVPAGGFLVGTGRNEMVNAANFKQTVVSVPSWSNRVVKSYDDALGVEVLLTRSVVDPSAALPATTGASWSQMRQVDDVHGILETTTLPGGAGSADRTYYDTVQMTWPRLLVGTTDVQCYNPQNAFEPQQRRSLFLMTPNLRSPVSELCNARVVENFITAAQVATLEASTPSGLGSATQRAELWSPRTVDLLYDGYLFSLNIPDVICDAVNLPASTNSLDTYYGYPKTDTFYGRASSPTYTQYAVMQAADGGRGQEVCIEDSVSPFRSGLWRRKRVYVRVK